MSRLQKGGQTKMDEDEDCLDLPFTVALAKMQGRYQAMVQNWPSTPFMVWDYDENRSVASCYNEADAKLIAKALETQFVIEVVYKALMGT